MSSAIALLVDLNMLASAKRRCRRRFRRSVKEWLAGATLNCFQGRGGKRRRNGERRGREEAASFFGLKRSDRRDRIALGARQGNSLHLHCSDLQARTRRHRERRSRGKSTSSCGWTR